MYTDNMKFIESHEWAKIDNDSIALVGISEHAQSLLGDIVYVELPKIGQKIKANTTIGVIESVKAASDLYSPIGGEVIEINEKVINDPAIINTSPHNDGWLVKIKLDNMDEFNQLLDVVTYQQNINL